MGLRQQLQYCHPPKMPIQEYSDQWQMCHGTYQIPRFTTISAFHASKMFYKKEALNIMTD
jgi:hypothetical protein